ncbi:MAG: hypothetical protein Q9216_000989 [Gyalolechia sp. 2 TL-2023]
MPVSAPPNRQGSSYDLQPGRYKSWNQQRRGRGSFTGRGRADVACSVHESSRKTQVAPAVPSFGNPLPTKPPALQEDSKKLKKKKRRVNQLGLTPKSEEHLSSSEDEDADEELKLASSVVASGISNHELKFTYKGQTSVLQSSTDIASWLEERRKRFPTAARKAENDARLQKSKEEREASKAKKLLERQLKTLEKDKQAAEQAAVEKSKLKVEKLRRKLEKEERRAAKAEAKTLKRSAPHEADDFDTHKAKKERYHSSPKADDVEDHCQEVGKMKPTDSFELGNMDNVSMSAEIASKLEDNDALKGSQTTPEHVKEEEEREPPSSIPDSVTPTCQPAVLGRESKSQPKPEPTMIDVSAAERKPIASPAPDSHGAPDACSMMRQEGLGDAISASSLDTSVHSDESSDHGDGDDETTSSGSSTSESESDSEYPETVVSPGARPPRVLPPKKSKKQEKAICRDFLRSGRCRRGKRCRWRHALPDRGQRKVEKSVLSRPERKSLHQRV